MGAPMAGHLVKAGRSVIVWNRTPAKTASFGAMGVTVAPTLEYLAAACDAILLCVTRSEDVCQCVEVIAAAAEPGTLIVDHSTIAPKVAKRLHGEMKARGFRFVDAPITGGSMGAQKGQLTIFCGGDEPDVAEAIEIVRPYAKDARRVGGPGQGQMMKLANQIAVGGALMGLCETLAFAKRAGLDLELTKDMIGGGAGGSWAFENYGPKVLAEDWTPGFSILNQRKDFGYCKETAAEIGASIPGTEVLDGLLARLEAAGHGDWTTAALYSVLLGHEG
jgi:3-hydroxyisobutyrate dehydrogenase-like beta-hydroxyacid dehydrogenase